MDATLALLEAVGQHAWPVAGVLLLLRAKLVKALCWNIVFRVMRIPLEQRQIFITQIARKDFRFPGGSFP